MTKGVADYLAGLSECFRPILYTRNGRTLRFCWKRTPEARPKPVLQATDVGVTATTICGTNLHILKGVSLGLLLPRTTQARPMPSNPCLTAIPGDGLMEIPSLFR